MNNILIRHYNKIIRENTVLRLMISQLEEQLESAHRQISQYADEASLLSRITAIVKHYTFEEQREIFVEECAEAIKAVQKLKRSHDENAVDDLIDEVADVTIMVEQMRLYLGKAKVDDRIRAKLDRQMRRMKGEKAE